MSARRVTARASRHMRKHNYLRNHTLIPSPSLLFFFFFFQSDRRGGRRLFVHIFISFTSTAGLFRKKKLSFFLERNVFVLVVYEHSYQSIE